MDKVIQLNSVHGQYFNMATQQIIGRWSVANRNTNLDKRRLYL